ncbi:MAG: type II 3-dehydroquinate dehydratase [Chloroflexi bacterium]|jgi:3-dehydroquinate dehydratase II|nr:type II 3-dehydroquinate dehydratase [Chloroflexota bacterium]MBT7080727.1 type II 3-dehydroquinate dehydratase [Chloroflexota bacterium]MBT7290870.1 type II 3-dehydroquinate dehydratase [Chloroflexota bacterium]
MKILVINGPNLNQLGQRDNEIYGSVSLDEINAKLADRAKALGIGIEAFQSNSEGDIVDAVQSKKADGIIINPGALTHYGLSLRDALADLKAPIIEVHLSNIHAREEWRQKSVIAPIALGQIAGLGYRSYLVALETLADILKEGS